MSSESHDPQKSEHKPFLFWFGLGSLIWITFLLYAGGFTTSIRAGMAFLDWPLSNGSINPEGWLVNDDMMAEHSHRLLGMVMGLLSIGLCISALATGANRQIRRLSVALVALVITQGLVGGLRVKLDALNLNIDHNLYAQTFAVLHGTLAQIFLCTLVAFVVMNSRSWNDRDAGFKDTPDRRLGSIGLAACATIVLQLVIGAVMRHSYAGLAIPTFPLTPYGTLVPPAFDFQVAIHFAHRVGGVVVTIAILIYVTKIWKDSISRQAIGKSAFALVALLAFQIYLGALVIWTVRNPHVATLHMLNGAFLLSICWMMTLRSLKFRLDPALLSRRVQNTSQEPCDLKSAAQA